MANNASVNAVIAQASPGDILQLSSSHPSFTVDKGVTIVGAAGSTFIQADMYGGAFPWTGGHVTVAVPAGQRASLSNLNITSGSDGYSSYWGTLDMQSGSVAVMDCTVSGYMTVSGGTALLQHVHVQSGSLYVSAGLCEIADSTFDGRNEGGGNTPDGNTTGMSVSGGSVVGSRLTIRGGNGAGFGTPFGQVGLSVLGGTMFLTDSAVIGGNGHIPATGAPAFTGSGTLFDARTTFTNGVFATTTSASHQNVPDMVGLSCSATPTRGATFTVTATAGSSPSLLGMIGGFDRTANTLPPVVEPLFGIPGQWIPLLVTAPAPGAAVPYAVPVPNVASLYGVDVWVQAAQWTASQIRASVVVGGSIR